MPRILRQYHTLLLTVLVLMTAPAAQAQFVLSQEVVDKQVEEIVAQYPEDPVLGRIVLLRQSV
jgi:hypothetical protein